MGKHKIQFTPLIVDSQMPMENLPLASRGNQANKGPTSPRKGAPKRIVADSTSFKGKRG